MAMAIAERTEGMAPTGPVRIQRAALIVNTRARRAAASFTRARALLTALGVPLVAAEALHDAARLRATVRAALDAGCELIILGGGDGSISAVVDDLAHHQARLGLLPLGTANDFARTLAIPTDLDAACATITRGTVAAIDLGLAGDTYFVNVVSIGLGAAVIPAASPTLKRLTGALAYPVAAARALRRVRPFAATLTFPDGDHPAPIFPRLLQVGVGNGRFYGGGLVVAPQAGLDEGLLDVCALAWGSWRDLVGVARSFKSGAFVHRPGSTTTAPRTSTSRRGPCCPSTWMGNWSTVLPNTSPSPQTRSECWSRTAPPPRSAGRPGAGTPRTALRGLPGWSIP